MKAYVLHGIQDIRLEEAEEPKLGEREVLVAVGAAGICGSDIPRIYKSGAYVHPLIPGHEFSGVVVKLGHKADFAWLGKRVGVFPLIPCRKCGPCQEKKYEMCRNYSYLGSRTDGGFAQLVRVPQWNLITIPDNVTFEQAAMLEPMAVAVHGMRRTALNKTGPIVIWGLGTIGLLLLMFLIEAGYNNLLAIGNKEIQKQLAMKMGLNENSYCDAGTSDMDSWIEARTDAQGAQTFFDCVGKNQVLSRALSHTAAGGTIHLIGNPVSDMVLEQNAYGKILRNQLTIFGTWNSCFTHQENDDWHYVLDRLEQGRVHPEYLITHRLPFGEFDTGFEIMRDKKEEYVKIMGKLDL